MGESCYASDFLKISGMVCNTTAQLNSATIAHCKRHRAHPARLQWQTATNRNKQLTGGVLCNLLAADGWCCPVASTSLFLFQQSRSHRGPYPVENSVDMGLWNVLDACSSRSVTITVSDREKSLL
jgi:hypothetical protein